MREDMGCGSYRLEGPEEAFKCVMTSTSGASDRFDRR